MCCTMATTLHAFKPLNYTTELDLSANKCACFFVCLFFVHKLISTPSRDTTLFIQQTEENEKQHCELALRKITVATIMGEGSDATITLQHHQLGMKFLLHR